MSLLPADAARACDDFYLEWRKVEISDEQAVEDGYLGVSEAVARLKSALKVERKINDNWPNRLKLAFVGWGKDEKPVSERRTADVIAAFNLFFPDKMIDMTTEKLATAPDFDKLAAVLPENSDDYAVSVVIKSSTMQWKTFLTRDISSMFKLRLILQEKVETEFKLVDKNGNLVFLDTFSVNPSQMFDFNYENTGYVEIRADRYSSDLIMNVIADALPPPVSGN